MASTLMIDDRLQIDKFNPTTWTGDFGINSDGFRKDLFMNGSYTTGIDETPMRMNDVIPVMNSTDNAGNMNLKTAGLAWRPITPFQHASSSTRMDASRGAAPSSHGAGKLGGQLEVQALQRISSFF